MLDTPHPPIADDEIPVLTELARLPHAEMPEGHVHLRRLALMREVADDRDAAQNPVTKPGVLRRHRLRWKIGIPALALGAAGVVALSLTLDAHSGPVTQGASSLAASWTPIPTRPTAAQLHDAVQQCDLPSARNVALAEQRGQVTVLLETTGPDYAACFVNAIGDGARPSYDVWPVAAKNQDFGARVMALPGEFAGALAFGRVAPDVAKATVTLTDGRVVTAMVDRGWACVWWPDKAAAKTITEYAADGSVL